MLKRNKTPPYEMSRDMKSEGCACFRVRVRPPLVSNLTRIHHEACVLQVLSSLPHATESHDTNKTLSPEPKQFLLEIISGLSFFYWRLWWMVSPHVRRLPKSLTPCSSAGWMEKIADPMPWRRLASFRTTTSGCETTRGDMPASLSHSKHNLSTSFLSMPIFLTIPLWEIVFAANCSKHLRTSQTDRWFAWRTATATLNSVQLPSLRGWWCIIRNAGWRVNSDERVRTNEGSNRFA